MAFQVPQWGFDFPINSSDLVIWSTQCHYAVHNGPLNEQKTQMTSTGPRTEPQKPNSITSYSQLIGNFENFLVENQHFFRFSTKKFEQKILEISEYLHMNPSACYGYKIKHFQVKFPQSIFILNKLWAAEQPQKWN